MVKSSDINTTLTNVTEQNSTNGRLLAEQLVDTAPKILDRAARLWPERAALSCASTGNRFTWKELRCAVLNLSERLVGAGIKEGVTVAVCSEITSDLVVLAHAVLHTGAVLAPLNLQFTPAETARYVETLKREFEVVCVSSKLYLDKFSEVDADLKYCFGDLPIADWLPVGLLKKRAALACDIFPSDPSYAIATSGSTSFPKATLATQRGLAHFGSSLVENVGLTPADRYLNVLPMFHLGGISMALAMVPLSGAELHLLPRFDPKAAIDSIRANRITVTTAWDGFFDMMAQAEGFTDDVFSTMKKCVLAGRSRYYNKLIGWGIERVVSFYGMTEGHMVTVLQADELDERIRASTSGRATEGTEIVIVDPETDVVVAEGGIGEIRYRGPGLFKRYIGEAEMTMEAFDSRGLFKSGDMGYFNGDNLVLAGRYKFMVKTGGENVSEADVEEAILSFLPEIASVAVVGAPDDRYGEIVYAFVEWRSEQRLGLQQIRERLRGKIANFKMPRGLNEIQTCQWPLTASGKVDKLKLRSLAAAQVLSENERP